MMEEYKMRVTAQDLRNVDVVLDRKDGDENYLDAIEHYVMYANLLGQHYVFIDKNILYSAINDSIIENGVKITTPAGHLYLDPKVDTYKFEEIYVLYNNEWYDLLNGDELDVEDEFTLYGKRKVKEDNITTDIDNIHAGQGTYKIIKDNNLYIIKDRKIYNANGAIIKMEN